MCSILVSDISEFRGGEGGKESREGSCIKCRPTFTTALSGPSVARYGGASFVASRLKVIAFHYFLSGGGVETVECGANLVVKGGTKGDERGPLERESDPTYSTR